MAPGMKSIALAVVAMVLVAAVGQAQFRGRRVAAQYATDADFDGAFNYCRVAYQGNRFGIGGGWSTDYPDADANLSIRLAELTKTRVSRLASGEPNHLIVRLTDDELFKCPFLMMQEVGAIYFDDEEAHRLRAHLLKGGFLWVDDFWGSDAWDVWAGEIAKVLPPSEYPIVDLQADHPLFKTMFDLSDGVPQVPSINHWMGSGGGTAERYDATEPHARAILDSHGRVLVLATHNTDVGDSWEREADDPRYFYHFSVDGYAFGINVLLYAMTH